MARKFLYLIAILIGLVIAGAIAFRLFPMAFMRGAFVPTEQFSAPAASPPNAYASATMWIARPDMTGENPTQWRPLLAENHPLHPINQSPGASFPEGEEFRLAPAVRRGNAAVFFVHPTSYLSRAHWNAPLDDEEANWRAQLFVRGMASVFEDAGDVWVPRYRQAALGAFLTSDVETANRALLAAYSDVESAFDQFVNEIEDDQPIILAGHSQGSLHLSRLLRDRIAGRPIARRIAAAYIIGWPVSVEQDLPAMGLPACEAAESSNCILAWQSFAEPMDARMILSVYDQTEGFVGGSRAGTRMLCVNPISGVRDGAALPADNLGAVHVTDDLTDGTLQAGAAAVGARCDDAAAGGRGFLLLSSAPDVGPYVLPGNNYHVFDYPLFWRNVRDDALRRLNSFAQR